MKEIIAKKFRHRGDKLTARDMLDFDEKAKSISLLPRTSPTVSVVSGP
ncbi:MAG: hypothetical protein JF619_22240 [Massilia sp.]|nr:hypothetical protein [Massilia sp.]